MGHGYQVKIKNFNCFLSMMGFFKFLNMLLLIDIVTTQNYACTHAELFNLQNLGVSLICGPDQIKTKVLK